MARTEATLHLNSRDEKRFKRMTSTVHLRRLLRAEVRQATILNSRAIKRQIKRELQTGRKAKQSELTIALKGSSSPLSDTGLLLRSISVTSVRWDSSRVGILEKGTRSQSGLTMPQLAAIVQNGAVIPVTRSMRGLFYVLWLASTGRNKHELNGRAAELFSRFQGWKPISPGTTEIIIPPRPFVANALNSRSLQLEIRRNYREAIQRAWDKRRV